MFGCHKNFPEPVKRIDSKYFLPDDIWSGPFKPYFSGAAYVMIGSAALMLANVKEDVQLLPMDDAYIGLLINRSNLTSRMWKVESGSGMMCNALAHMWPTGSFLNTFPCILAGLPFSHKYSPADIELAFRQLHDPTSKSTCRQYVNETQRFVKSKFGATYSGTWRRFFEQYWK